MIILTPHGHRSSDVLTPVAARCDDGVIRRVRLPVWGRVHGTWDEAAMVVEAAGHAITGRIYWSADGTWRFVAAHWEREAWRVDPHARPRAEEDRAANLVGAPAIPAVTRAARPDGWTSTGSASRPARGGVVRGAAVMRPDCPDITTNKAPGRLQRPGAIPTRRPA